MSIQPLLSVPLSTSGCSFCPNAVKSQQSTLAKIYALLTKCEVKMAVCWSSSFFAFTSLSI